MGLLGFLKDSLVFIIAATVVWIELIFYLKFETKYSWKKSAEYALGAYFSVAIYILGMGIAHLWAKRKNRNVPRMLKYLIGLFAGVIGGMLIFLEMKYIVEESNKKSEEIALIGGISLCVIFIGLELVGCATLGIC